MQGVGLGFIEAALKIMSPVASTCFCWTVNGRFHCSVASDGGLIAAELCYLSPFQRR